MATRQELKALAAQAAGDATLAASSAETATAADKYVNAANYPEVPPLATMRLDILIALEAYEIAAQQAADDAEKIGRLAKQYVQSLPGVGGDTAQVTTAKAVYDSAAAFLEEARVARKKLLPDEASTEYLVRNAEAITAVGEVDVGEMYVLAGVASDMSQVSARAYADAAALKAVELNGE